MDVREYEEAVLRRMTPAQKLAVLRGLIRQAYALKEAWVRRNHPGISESELREQVRQLIAGETAEPVGDPPIPGPYR